MPRRAGLGPFRLAWEGEVRCYPGMRVLVLNKARLAQVAPTAWLGRYVVVQLKRVSCLPCLPDKKPPPPPPPPPTSSCLPPTSGWLHNSRHTFFFCPLEHAFLISHLGFFPPATPYTRGLSLQEATLTPAGPHRRPPVSQVSLFSQSARVQTRSACAAPPAVSPVDVFRASTWRSLPLKVSQPQGSSEHECCPSQRFPSPSATNLDNFFSRTPPPSQHPFAQWLSTSYRSPCKLSLRLSLSLFLRRAAPSHT